MGLRRWLGLAAFAVMLGVPATAVLAQCGNGTVDSNEECDPGGAKHCNGDPNLRTCTTGAQCGSGVNCYYVNSCCKFNCQYVGEGASCSDGDPCTSPDTCNNVGECSGNSVSGNTCDDGSICTTGDTCNNGVCQGTLSLPPQCNDGNPCTDDGCDLEGGCTNTPNTAACNDGQLCTAGDVCSGGTCAGTPTVPPACNDGNSCTTDTCSASGNGGAGACVNTNLDAVSCSDGQFCTTGDTCSNGTCIGTPFVPPSCNDANICTTDSCNPLANGGTGACSNTNNTASCDDGQYCTENDVCSGGSCGGTPRTCSDDNTCTTDSCNETTNACDYSVVGANGTACDDNNVCTSGTTCNNSGQCTGGSSINCSDGIACTADTCHPISGCQNIPAEEGRGCLDSCTDGYDNDGDDGVDYEDTGCATLAQVQRFAVLASRSRGTKGFFAGSDVTVAGVSADGVCNLDDNRCDCAPDGPRECLSLDRPCSDDGDCRTAVPGTCDSVLDVCACPAEYPNCQADGRPCATDDDCGVAPYPRGDSLGGLCGYSGEVRAGTQLGFLASSANLKFGKGSTLDRTLELLRELATDGGTMTLKKTSAPVVGPTVCSSDLSLVCEDDAECPPAVDVCILGQCTGHLESCDADLDCAPACDARRRLDDGTCIGNPALACTLDADCAGAGDDCVHPFITTDGSSENFQLCDAALALRNSGPVDVSDLLADISEGIANYVPAPSEVVDFPAACEACPTLTTPDGDPSCVPCPDATEIRTRSTSQKMTITVGGGLQILDLGRVRLAGNTVLRLLGQDDTVLVVRLTSSLRLGGLAQVTVGSNGTGNGSLRVENTLWNVQGRTGGPPNFIRECLFQGTVLAPQRPGARLGADVRVEGAVLSKKVQIGGPSTVVHIPFTGLVPTAP